MSVLPRATRVAAGWLVALAAAPLGSAQPRSLPDSTALRLVEVRFSGERPLLSDEALRLQLRSVPNRRFFGVPGLTPGLWVYRLGAAGLPAPITRALRRTGEAPAFLDTALVRADADRLAVLYRQEGYLAARVAPHVDTLAGGRARITFAFDVGAPTWLRRLRFDGLSALTAAEADELVRTSTLRLRPDGIPLEAGGEGQRFSERELLAERRRLLDFLRARGFAGVDRDSIRAVIFNRPDPFGPPPDSVDVALVVRPGPRYRFGDVRFVVAGPETAAARRDTAARGDGRVFSEMVGETRLSPGLLRRALRLTPGEVYDHRALLATKRRLDRTGVFAFSEIVALPPDSSGGARRLPHRIGLRTRPRHAVRIEGFVLQRTGLLGVAAEEIGLGAGATYRNANLFGAGEALAVRGAGSVAGGFEGGFPDTQFEGTVALTVPYLVPPFGGVEQRLQPFDARSRFSLGFLNARREALGVLIRARASVGARFEVQHAPPLTSAVDLVDFYLSDPDTLAGFSERFLQFVEDPVARQFLLEDYTRPQVNNALRYTLRALTADPFRRDRGYAVEVSVEAGGHLPALLDRFVFTPGAVEGSLPGLAFLGGAVSRLEYRPYVRVLADARRYLPAGTRGLFAFKALVGAALPTGQAPVVPFDRRFYVGGASSVRGWRLRTLGPGAVDDAGGFVQGGDLKVELSAETRRVVIRRFLGADWAGTAFVDAGNVWFGPRNPGDPAGRFRVPDFVTELGVGAGLGVRVAWDYLILRFDLAWKVHSPVPGSDLFPEGLYTPLFHFGIGQAF